MMPNLSPRSVSALFLLAACALLGRAEQPEPAPPPRPLAVLELILPAGATATADGKELGSLRTVPVAGLAPTETRRVKVIVTFADGTSDERLVDVAASRRVTVPVYHPGAERPAIVAPHALTPINGAAVGRDGRYIAVALEDRAVVLWDTLTGRPEKTFLGHQKVVLSVAFSPDGKHLVSGSTDTTAILWDVVTGARLKTYTGHTGSVVSIAFSPDGARVFTGSPDGTAILRDTHSGEVIHTFKSKEVLGVAYSPDGNTVATASSDTTAVLWDAKSGKQTVVLRGHKEGVSSVRFSPDGGRVVTGSFENIGIVWDAATGKRLATTGRHGNDVYSVAFTLDGRRVLTGEREEVVILSDAVTGAHLRTFAGHNADIVSIIPRPDGQTVLTGSRDGTVRLWDLATGRELLALTTDSTRKAWAVVGPDGLFDASEAGRRALGFRFSKVGGEIDQFFTEGYHPGLLAEVWRGERPFAAKPLGRSKPPLVKLVPPKSRVSSVPEATLAVDVTDQGGGVSGFAVENNGVRLAVATKPERAPDGKATRITFTVPLAPGVNKLRVRASSADGSWESIPANVELTHPRVPGQRGRMYVVAVGVSEFAEKGLNLAYPAKDAQALAELLQTRGKEYDRVDIVPVYDRDATKATIEDTVKDVAELSRPQDAVVVLLCGHGALVGGRLHFAPHDLRIGTDRSEEALRARGIAVDDLAAALGTAPALRRVLVVDTAASGAAFGGALEGRPEFALRGAVERWGRAYGIYALAVAPATTSAVEHPEPRRGVLAHALLTAADEGAAGSLDAADWLRSAADRAGSMTQKLTGTRQDVQVSSQSRGFPVLAPGK